jgi:uncharacterized ferredoxin-like protein
MADPSPPNPRRQPSLDNVALRIDALRHVASLCATAAITAPKSGGQLFLKGSPPFIETLWVEDVEVRKRLASWLRARGRERREAIWFRDARVCERVDGILSIGLKDWYPPVYDCGACGYATCAEFLDATAAKTKAAGEKFEFAGPTCNLRDIDLGIAVGSAAKTASLNNVDCRCQTRVAVAARHVGLIGADVAVALSLSITHKALGFDRPMPEMDWTSSDTPEGPEADPPGLEPHAAPSGARSGGRHRQVGKSQR